MTNLTDHSEQEIVYVHDFGDTDAINLFTLTLVRGLMDRYHRVPLVQYAQVTPINPFVKDHREMTFATVKINNRFIRIKMRKWLPLTPELIEQQQVEKPGIGLRFVTMEARTIELEQVYLTIRANAAGIASPALYDHIDDTISCAIDGLILRLAIDSLSLE